MSKSLGNSPDPLDLIARYGADGLRFGMVSLAPQGQDIRFQQERIEGGKNFCNKLWNACRFRQLSGPAGDNSSLAAILARLDRAQFDADDHAIVARLLATAAEVERHFREFEFSAAAQALYGFFWNDFCDWYVEVSKSRLPAEATRGHCLALQDFVLRQTLLLLHPFIPFITEELWHLLGYSAPGEGGGAGGGAPPAPPGAADGRLLMRDARLETGAALAAVLAARGLPVDADQAASVAAVKTLVSQARALKAEHNLASRRDVRFFLIAADGAWAALAPGLAKVLRLAGAAAVERRDAVEGAPAVVTPFGTLFLDLAGTVDVGAEKIRLAKELEKLAQHIAGTAARLANPAFVGKAPPAVLDGARAQLAGLQAKHAEVERLLKALG
jgi:valyl-tRNA synthetase